MPTVKLNPLKLVHLNFIEMGKYLDFENEKYEKGYQSFFASRESFKENIGKTICFVTKADVSTHRGTYVVRYGTIHSVKYSSVFLDENGCRQIDIRDILECGISIKDEANENK